MNHISKTVTPPLHASYSAACERNQHAIFSVLSAKLAHGSKVFEIGSGSGQHAAYFLLNRPDLLWQCADLEINHRCINSWLTASQSQSQSQSKFKKFGPVNLDLLSTELPQLDSFLNDQDAVYSANTAHFIPRTAVEKLFEVAASLLKTGGRFYLYGPFKYNGKFTSDSNREFNNWLLESADFRAIRDFDWVNTLAEQNGLQLLADHTMPANNQMLEWQKR